MCCLNEVKGNSAHKEGTSIRINRDENDVQKLVGCLILGLMTNLFPEDADQLLNIATGVVLPTDIAECLKKRTTAVRAQMNQFIRKNLNSNQMSFWEPLPSLKIQIFDLAVNKGAVKAADEKMFTIGRDRDLFCRFLLAA